MKKIIVFKKGPLLGRKFKKRRKYLGQKLIARDFKVKDIIYEKKKAFLIG